jgi:serine protease Do
LTPIQWAAGGVSIGQWAINPGIAETPQAVGVISALSHRIRPARALIGVQFDFRTSTPRIEDVIPGFGAEKAGVKPGDIIVALNSVTVTNREQIVETIRDFREGRTVKLRLRRAEKEFDAEVRLRGARSAELGGELNPEQRQSRLTGEVSQRAEGFEDAIEHDSVLPPWMCGGPLVNLDGKAIGLNIARADRVTTYALPARLVKQILDRLKSKNKLAAR